jgi:hypothetical protein
VVWPPSLLAMVVTSRESCIGDGDREVELFGEEYARALLLPFTKQQVSGRLRLSAVYLVVIKLVVSSLIVLRG